MEHPQWRPFQYYQTHNGDALKGQSCVVSAVLSFMLNTHQHKKRDGRDALPPNSKFDELVHKPKCIDL